MLRPKRIQIMGMRIDEWQLDGHEWHFQGLEAPICFKGSWRWKQSSALDRSKVGCVPEFDSWSQKLGHVRRRSASLSYESDSLWQRPQASPLRPKSYRLHNCERHLRLQEQKGLRRLQLATDRKCRQRSAHLLSPNERGVCREEEAKSAQSRGRKV